MKLSDYVAQFLSDAGITHVFGLTGGAVVHLFDSIAKTKNITPVFTHHEQAAALAAQAYARVRNDVGCAIVTTGPGGTNAVTGLLAAWLDSIPCIYISGQSRLQHTSRGKSIRQLGSQEFDIVSLVSHITKYAVMVDDPNKIKYYLQKAIFVAKTGRPGPVWIDIPLDFQWATVNPQMMESFDAKSGNVLQSSDSLDSQIRQCWELLYRAKKPLLLAGHGIRLAHAEEEFKKLIKIFNLPFVSSWNVSDLVPTDNSSYMGRIGVMGQRGANQIVQSCDFLLALGSHLCLTLTGLDTEGFISQAKKVIVDIDPVEINFRMVKTDLAIQSDLKVFLQKLLKLSDKKPPAITSEWKKSWSLFKSHNAIDSAFKMQKKFVNPYVFVDALSDELDDKEVIVVDGGGTVVYISFQAFKIKQGQRLILSSGLCSMGTGLPESIGACMANGRRRTICTIGDGSLQLNIQELQTIAHHKLPIKIFVFNNNGYLSIRHTQTAYLDKKFIGSSSQGGLSLPDFQKVAKAYGIKTTRINNHGEMLKKIKSVLKENGPVLCEIMISPDQQLISAH